jgi:RHS repeat-associated protein
VNHRSNVLPALLLLATFLFFASPVSPQTQTCGGYGQSACPAPPASACSVSGSSAFMCLPLQEGNWNYSSDGEPYDPIFGGSYSTLGGFGTALINAYAGQFPGIAACGPAFDGIGGLRYGPYTIWGIPNVYGDSIALSLWSYNGLECVAPSPDPSPGTVRLTREVICPVNYSPGQSSGNYACGCNPYWDCSVPRCIPCNGGLNKGDSTDVTIGNVTEEATDDPGNGVSPLRFTRTYNSLTASIHYLGYDAPPIEWPFGVAWSATYFQYISYVSSSDSGWTGAYVYRPNGSVLAFNESSGTFAFGGETSDTLVWTYDGSGNKTGWLYTADDASQEVYNLAGQLTSITRPGGVQLTMTYGANGYLSTVSDAFGHTLSFTWDNNPQPRVTSVNDSSAGSFAFTYDSYDNLNTVTYADSTEIQYLYELPASNNQQNLLTGQIDESGNRIATWGYTYGTGGYVANSSQQAGGVNSYSFTYNYDGSRTIVDPLGTTRTYQTAFVGAQRRYTGVNAGCAGCGDYQALSYDINGNFASKTDFNGNTTTYVHDLTRNLETSRTEASSTSAARTITTTWNSSFALPATVTEPNRTTSYTYDSNGNVLTKTITAATVSRTWTYTYDSYGRVLTAKGPRTDVNSTTSYAYYTCTTGTQCGQLHTVTDAAGNVTTYNTYNGYSQPLTITDPNGVVTTLTYDARQRMTSRQVGSETTAFAHYPTGLLEKVTLPDSSYIQYTYDSAHRLTGIADNAGNTIAYTLDGMGNRTAENSYDPSDTLHRTHSRVYNSLNELASDINAAGTSAVTTTYGYDSNANQTSISAPISRYSANTFDPLNRLNQITDPASGVTQFAYDAEDDLTSVEDPRGLTTSYTYDGFGDVTQQVSPDSGTSSSTFDSGGNLSVSTDARGSTATYSYDVLNRVTSIVYKNSSSVTDQTLALSYDSGTNGKGRLNSAGDGNETLSWVYDGLGRVTGKGQTVGTVTKSVGYAYTNGDLTGLATPSGQSVVYTYNSNHQVTGISVNGTTVLNSTSYEPFGGANGWTWGSGDTVSRTYNGDGLISQIVSASVTNGYSFDYANRITAISDSSDSTLSWAHGYDALDRITSAATSSITDGWTYDADGNRLTQTGTNATTFAVNSGNNQLSDTSGALSRTYVYDAAGHTLAYGSNVFTYNNRGRMNVTGSGSTAYLYNALGQLVEKAGTGGTNMYVYDESGHILGEYDGSGTLIEETVWLGDIPVATLQPNGSSVAINYVQTNHLNTPTKVTRPSDNALVWRIDQDPFGTASANQNPSGFGTFVYNLRLPGQLYMAETGLNQNVNRDYDPLIGRYVESDPIGVLGLHKMDAETATRKWMLLTGRQSGGPPLASLPEINPYQYALNDPVDVIDPTGQFGVVGAALIAVPIAAGLVIYSIYKCNQACQLAGVCPYAQTNDPEGEGRRNQWIELCKWRCIRSFGESAKLGPW